MRSLDKLGIMMNFSGGEIFVILLIALILVGPERLPQYAGQLGRLVRTLKEMMSGAKTTLKEELGDDYAELQKFDPRQYDPRRIVREALLDDVVPSSKPASSAAPKPASSSAGRGAPSGASVAAAGAAAASVVVGVGATPGGVSADGESEPAQASAHAEAGAQSPAAGEALPVGAPFDDEAT